MIVDVERMLEALGIESEEAGSAATEMWACCPYPEHDESTPSWSIKNDEQDDKHGSHYCFGCGRGGSPVDLVIAQVGLSGFGAAIAWLEERKLDIDGVAPLNIELILKMPAKHEMLELAYGIRADYSKWTTNAKRYAKERGITEHQIHRWSIGCVPMGPLAGRMYIPAYDQNQRLLSYTARDYTGDARSRYKEPSGKGMDGAHPGAVFGEEHWPKEHTLRRELVLCEGAFNAMACERVGAANIAALFGSDLTNEQLLKLKTWDTIILASDLDAAGNKMARKILAALGRWSDIRRVQFTDKRDPNDLERENPALLKDLLWPTA